MYLAEKEAFMAKWQPQASPELSQNTNLDHIRLFSDWLVPLWLFWIQHSNSNIFQGGYCLLAVHATLTVTYSKWLNVYYSCGKGNLQCNIKIRFLSSLQCRPDSFHTLFLLQQHWEDQISSICSEHLFFLPVLIQHILIRTSLTALHSLETVSGSSLCAQSMSWALLCPWRWWCLYKSTCSPGSGGCDSSPPSPTGRTRWVTSTLLIVHNWIQFLQAEILSSPKEYISLCITRPLLYVSRQNIKRYKVFSKS